MFSGVVNIQVPLTRPTCVNTRARTLTGRVQPNNELRKILFISFCTARSILRYSAACRFFFLFFFWSTKKMYFLSVKIESVALHLHKNTLITFLSAAHHIILFSDFLYF